MRTPGYIIGTMFFSFSLSELVPFMVVVYGIYLQIDWNRHEGDLNTSHYSEKPLPQTPGGGDDGTDGQ